MTAEIMFQKCVGDGLCRRVPAITEHPSVGSEVPIQLYMAGQVSPMRGIDGRVDSTVAWLAM